MVPTDPDTFELPADIVVYAGYRPVGKPDGPIGKSSGVSTVYVMSRFSAVHCAYTVPG